MVDDSESSFRRTGILNIKTEVATKMHEDSKNAVIARMEAKIKEEDERIQARRAKQEQHLAARATKKATLQEAKDAEALADRCATDLEDILKERKDSKKKLESKKEAIKTLEQDIRYAQEAIAKAQEKHDALVDKLLAADANLKEATIDPSIVELKSQRLREAWDNSRTAWDRIQKSIRKKEHNRGLKKRVKGLLGF